MKYYNAIFLLLLQTPTFPPDRVWSVSTDVANYFTNSAQQEIFVAAINSRMVLVLHARELEKEVDADIQVWPSGRVKLKNEKDLDGNTKKFWYSLTLVSRQVKEDICR